MGNFMVPAPPTRNLKTYHFTVIHMTEAKHQSDCGEASNVFQLYCIYFKDHAEKSGMRLAMK
jgi:hypothetical protein